MLKIKQLVLIGGPFDGASFAPAGPLAPQKFFDIRGTMLRGAYAPELAENFKNVYVRYARRNCSLGTAFYEYRTMTQVESEHQCT